MLKHIRTIARQYDDQFSLTPLDAHILTSIEAGDSIEQISRRLGMTPQAVQTALRRVKGDPAGQE